MAWMAMEFYGSGGGRLCKCGAGNELWKMLLSFSSGSES